MVKAATQNEGEGEIVPQVAATSLSNEMMRAEEKEILINMKN